MAVLGLPGASGKEPACQCRRHKRWGFSPWIGKIPWRRVWQPSPAFLPGESHGQRSLGGYSPWGRKESDTTERLHFTNSWYTERAYSWKHYLNGWIWETMSQRENQNYSCIVTSPIFHNFAPSTSISELLYFYVMKPFKFSFSSKMLEIHINIFFSGYGVYMFMR